MTTPKRRRYISASAQDAIEELAERAYTPKQIEDALSVREDLKGQLPTLRTIQRIVSEHHDESSPWTVEKAGHEDPAVAFEVLRDVAIENEGRIRALTVSEAKWITSLRRLAPELPSWETYRLARLYISRTEGKQPTADLDAFLVFGPWDAERRPLYQAVIDRGEVDAPPVFLEHFLTGEARERGLVSPPESRLVARAIQNGLRSLEDFSAHHPEHRHTPLGELERLIDSEAKE